MLKLINNEHEEEKEEVDFEKKLIGVYQQSLQRIINEVVRIKGRKAEELLNSKQEYHDPSVKRRN